MNRYLSRPFAVAAALWPAAAGACPVCDASTGREVRAALADERLGPNLVATLLPFPIVLGVVAAVHFGGSGRRRGPSRRRHPVGSPNRGANGSADADPQLTEAP